MEEFVEFKRRIRPELADEIARLYMRDMFGYEGDPQEEVEGDREREKAIVKEFSKTRPGLTVEKALWAMDQQIQMWEHNVIKMGEDFLAIKTHETKARYLEALKRIAGGKISDELAAAHILAYEEDKRNG